MAVVNKPRLWATPLDSVCLLPGAALQLQLTRIEKGLFSYVVRNRLVLFSSDTSKSSCKLPSPKHQPMTEDY